MHFQFANIDSLENLLAEQQERVRRAPTAATERFRLFQVMSLLGDWNSADRQLRHALDYDASLLPMIRSYQLIVEAELQRARNWKGEQPVKLDNPSHEEWAQRLAADSALIDAPERLAQSLAEAPALRGEIDIAVEGKQPLRTEAFQWIADGDCRLGPMLELIGQHGYYRMPLTDVREVEISAPQSGCDRLWARVAITRNSGDRLRATIPVRYAGDYGTQSTALLLGRATSWFALGDETLQLFGGEGQRMWITESGEYALLDVRAIRLFGNAK